MSSEHKVIVPVKHTWQEGRNLVHSLEVTSVHFVDFSFPICPQNYTGCCHCSWLSIRSWWGDPTAKDIVNLGRKTWRNQVNTDGEAWLARLQSNSRCFMGLWSRKFTNVLLVFELWATVMTNIARYVHGCNNIMNIMGVTSSFLIRFNNHSTAESISLVLYISDQVPIIRKWVGTRGQTTIILW